MTAASTNGTLKEWVNLYSNSLFSWAMHKTSSKETAEDLVQETFLAAVKSIEKFQGNSQPKTWLMGILNHKINDHYRKSFRKSKVIDTKIIESSFDETEAWRPGEAPMAWTEEESHLLDNSDFNKTLSHCLEGLPATWNAAMQLKYLSEKKGDVICQELDITPTNFWQILHRAKLQLRKCLDLNWFNKEN